MTNNEIIKALECLCGVALKCRECQYSNRYQFPLCRQRVAKHTLDLIDRQQAEIDRLKIENQSLRMAANSYKIHYNNAVEDFTEFAHRAFDNPFACQYCVFSIEDGRDCLWKEEHKEDEEFCLGRYFEYTYRKVAGDTE